MKALSVRQPWAWLIVHGWKDVENRNWPTDVRGPVLIHASSTVTWGEYYEAMKLTRAIRGDLLDFPPFEMLEHGGIVGIVEIVDCVEIGTKAPSLVGGSPWFFGRYGFVMKDAKVTKFIPLKGKLKFFDVVLST